MKLSMDFCQTLKEAAREEEERIKFREALEMHLTGKMETSRKGETLTTKLGAIISLTVEEWECIV